MNVYISGKNPRFIPSHEVKKINLFGKQHYCMKQYNIRLVKKFTCQVWDVFQIRDMVAEVRKYFYYCNWKM